MVAHETSGATTRLILGYVRKHAGGDAVADVLRRADVPHTLAELEDESRWVSYDTRVRLFEAAVAVLGDPRAPYRMGAESLRAGMNASLVLLLRALGSPRQVYRQLPRAVPKFTTTSTMEVVESGATHATLRYRLHDGYPHSRLDCAYAQGLIAVVPEIFGLPAATLVHDECEADGHPACVYHLTWARRRLPWRRREAVAAADDVELLALRSQLEALQSAASDLVSSDDLTAVLRRITQRAAAAVLAPAYLLALHDPDGGEPLVHAEGLDADRASALGARLLAGDDLGPGAVVVDVASSRRLHGRLAALYAPGQRGPANERPMLAAYAGHAAAALDLLMALERSRRGESRSAALLTLAHELRAATDAETVGQAVVTAMRRIAACQSVSVMLWDPAAGELRPVACEGLPQRERELFMASAVRVEETPELAGLLMRQEPTVIDTDTATPLLREYLRALGVDDVIAVPLLAGGELLGAATVSWRAARRPALIDDLLVRLQGVGEYAAAALENVRLLGTVRHQSLHDALTGLPNRVLFVRHLERTLREAGPAGGTAVLFCDLDRFKHVNDVLGHAAGDELLRQVAARLRGVLRTSDMVGRLSGDEFALLLPDVTDPLVAEQLGQRVVAGFADPFRVEGRELRVTTSVGVALHAGADGRADLLIRAADGAMYDAKQRGRNQVAVASDGVRTGAVPSTDGHPSLEAELQAALTGEGPAGEGLRLFFMPVVDTTGTGLRLAGAEALVRWEHPRLGLLPPGAFLPMAEEAGLIADLDLWAVGAACQAAVGWPTDGEPPHVAVNLAADTLLDPRLLPTVRGALAHHGLAPDRLHLEIVESRSLVDLAGVIERLAELRQLGVRISLDDFGTGYSTLAWLQRLPVDQVKIDRSFVQGLPGDAASLAVVRGVLALARELGLEVVAEGVETAEQLAALRDAGCSLVQGYLLGAPAPGAPGLDPRARALRPADRPARSVELVAA